MRETISKWIMDLYGWKMDFRYTDDLKKCIVVVAPHTSNWDFVWGILARNVLHMKARYLIKHTLFKPGLAWFFNWTGGIPVNRSINNDLTTKLKKLINETDHLHLVFTPEGTRKRVKRWKQGFYWVAQETGLPIVLHSLDFKTKDIKMFGPFHPTGDWKKDKLLFEEFYRDVEGFNQEDFNHVF